jgi:DNA-binding NarL/FixJ family response regulator
LSIRIFVVEDHAVVREGLRMLASSSPDCLVVGEAGTGAAALENVRALAPDIVLLDLDLGGQDGAALVPALLERVPQARVVIFTGVADPRRHEAALLAGARGLVRKDEDTGILLRAIHKVHDGELWFARPVVDAALQRSRSGRGTPTFDRLTDRERDLVALVAAGLRNAQIAERLDVSEKTVRNQLTAVYAKLGVSDRMQLLLHAQRRGLDRFPT